MTIFDRLVEDPEFYVMVQKVKLAVAIGIGLLVVILKWDSILKFFGTS